MRRGRNEEPTTEADVPRIDFCVTGSRVYGVNRLDSDLDIVMRCPDVEQYLKDLKDKGINVTTTSDPTTHYDGLRFDLCGITINIISVADYDFESWKEATEKMLDTPPIEDKEERVEQFMRFFDEA